jgi:hypothetical protein
LVESCTGMAPGSEVVVVVDIWAFRSKSAQRKTDNAQMYAMGMPVFALTALPLEN